jgi:GNAT superfamily N-acetyltransferase
MSQPDRSVEIHPLTPERFADLETLFGPHGASGGCWCMWWRVPRSQFDREKGEANRRAFKAVVESGKEPGLLAYVDGAPAGWVAVAPRDEYPGLARSRILSPVDNQPVWAVTCFFIGRRYRRLGLTVALLEAAVRYAGERGARIVEGYPVEPKADRMPDAFVYHGLASAFRKAGFSEVARRSETRPIMRRTIADVGTPAHPGL